MAILVSELQSMLDMVVRAIGNPRLRARAQDGREVEYRSMDDALKAKAALEDLIREASGGAASSVSVAQHSRGMFPRGHWH